MNKTEVAIAMLTFKKPNLIKLKKKFNNFNRQYFSKNFFKKAILTSSLLGALMFSPLQAKSNSSIPNPDDSSLNNSASAVSVEQIYEQTNKTQQSAENSLEARINMIAESTDFDFKDNEMYKQLRQQNAEKQLQRKDIKDYEYSIVVDKTFQKLLVYRQIPFEVDGKIISKPVFSAEYDCSTGKNSGNKQKKGDSKTPEGSFKISSVENSIDWKFGGKNAYGAYFARVIESIGIHGNGSDNEIAEFARRNGSYSSPEPLGLYAENFSNGKSHGCIRLGNKIIRYLIEKNIITNGTTVVIYEYKELSNLLAKTYSKTPNNETNIADVVLKQKEKQRQIITNWVQNNKSIKYLNVNNPVIKDANLKERPKIQLDKICLQKKDMINKIKESVDRVRINQNLHKYDSDANNNAAVYFPLMNILTALGVLGVGATATSFGVKNHKKQIQKKYLPAILSKNLQKQDIPLLEFKDVRKLPEIEMSHFSETSIKKYQEKDIMNNIETQIKTEKITYESNYSKAMFNHLIDNKNKYNNLLMKKIAGKVKQTSSYISGKSDLEKLLKKAMKLKANDKNYSDLKQLNFDERLTTYTMKQEIVKMYADSNITLNEASHYFEKKYGLHISRTTLSKRAREYMNARLNYRGYSVNDREEAKTHYVKYAKKYLRKQQ